MFSSFDMKDQREGRYSVLFYNHCLISIYFLNSITQTDHQNEFVETSERINGDIWVVCRWVYTENGDSLLKAKSLE